MSVIESNYNPDMGIRSEDISFAWGSWEYYLPFEYESYHTEKTFDICLFVLKDYMYAKYNSAVENSILFEFNSKSFSSDGGPIEPTINKLFFKKINKKLCLYANVTTKPYSDLLKEVDGNYESGIDEYYYMTWSPIVYIDADYTFNVVNFNISDADVEQYMSTHNAYSVELTERTKTARLKLELAYDEPGQNWEWRLWNQDVDLDGNGVFVVESILYNIRGSRYDIDNEMTAQIGYTSVNFGYYANIIGYFDTEPDIDVDITYYELNKTT